MSAYIHYVACSSVSLPAYTVNVHVKDDLQTDTMQNTAFNNRIDCNTLNAGFPPLPSILLTDGRAADDSGV